jgi:hypothetical protein
LGYQWDELLSGWKEFNQDRSGLSKKAIGKLLSGYHAAVLRSRKSQHRTAEEFNLFSLLDIANDERRHSVLLAWLLDRRGTHAQMESGLKALLHELHLDPGFAERPYHVRREVAGEQSRIDVEVSSRGSFLIHFENKIWAGEGENQLERESEDLLRRAEELGVPPAQVHAYYLTPTGGLPSNPGLFKPLRWTTIAKVFGRYSEQAQAESVRWFTRHYAEALSELLMDPAAKEEL